MIRVLETHGSDYLDRPEALKFLLAPLLAHSEAEQELFYTIFDNYLEEAGKWEPPMEESLPPPSPLLGRYVWWILGALGVLFIAFIISIIITKHDPPAWGIIAPPKAHLDSTLSIRNAGGDLDTNRFSYHWAIRDEATNTVELQDSQLLEWRPRISDLGGGPHKIVDFRVIDRSDRQEVHRSQSPLLLVCPPGERPVIQKIDLPKEEIRPGQPVTFRGIIEDDENLSYEWRLEDSILTDQRTLVYTFDEVGKYRIRLTVRDTTAATICAGDKLLEINVQEEEEPLALLSLMSLKKDSLEPVAYFRSWLWWFLLLPLGLCVYAWWRWWEHKKKMEREREKAREAKIAAAVARDQEKKQPPFIIPFSDQNQYIQRDAVSQRLADALRQRQEGRRKQLDVALSLEATVGQGGFPSPRYRFDHQATEYLFLIDRQAPGSHQFDLFHFLVDELHRQEAYIETFYYD
ncbi:MAG: PKD domain-containing protein, partial [Saprospiraceae bacterium]